ncbi:MAG: hypothetical protein ACI8W8_000218 [Rhodothermales bacterium]|jgi:hypothetical protein
MRYFILALVSVAAYAQVDWATEIAKKLPPGETATALFNGTDLSGWDGQEGIWSVANGAIRGANEGHVPSSTYLFTKKSYRNFRLLLEVKQTQGAKLSPMHSAVAALGERFTDKGENTHGFKGPLLMCCNDWGIWDAYRRNRLVPKGHRGTLKVKSERVGAWNQIEILVIENRIRFVNNGELIFDFTDAPDMLKPSPIGLQIHANRKAQEFHFRGLLIEEEPSDGLISLRPTK